MACGGMIFIKNFKLKKNFHFILFHLIFFMYYCCSINFKRQSEHSGLRPDTSSFFLMEFFESFQNHFENLVGNERRIFVLLYMTVLQYTKD